MCKAKNNLFATQNVKIWLLGDKYPENHSTLRASYFTFVLPDGYQVLNSKDDKYIKYINSHIAGVILA